jgi:hypothetical protein
MFDASHADTVAELQHYCHSRRSPVAGRRRRGRMSHLIQQASHRVKHAGEFSITLADLTRCN